MLVNCTGHAYNDVPDYMAAYRPGSTGPQMDEWGQPVVPTTKLVCLAVVINAVGVQ